MTLTTLEASKLAHVTTQTIVEWYHKGRITGTQTATGRILVDRDSLMQLVYPGKRKVHKLSAKEIVERAGRMYGRVR